MEVGVVDEVDPRELIRSDGDDPIFGAAHAPGARARAVEFSIING